MSVVTVTYNPNKRSTLFARYGSILTAAESSDTASTDYGKEIDLGAVYQLSPSALLQFDYGFFTPGAFFINKAVADLYALKLKFTF